ncbi:MAG: polyphosphate kinase 2 family protein [Gemmatimonadota bacterium]
MHRYRIEPGSTVRLSDVDPGERLSFDGKKELGNEYLEQLTVRLRSLQELLYAEGRHRILVVLQAMDTGGKDGVIRHVFRTVNPQGVKVAGFKAPSSQELAHDYLWRIHKETPARGEIRIFNRSHYEDVLVVRVRNLVPPEVWERRYNHIREFERMLADEGTTILKFFLHISKDEQAERLQARLDDPDKHWKFSPADLEERKLWDDYQQAFEVALTRTSTPWAPWYVVPANSKWYRNLVVARVLVDTLEGLDMRFPESSHDLEGIQVE